MAVVKMSLSSSWSCIWLACAVFISMQSFGMSMECTTSEDEQVCERSCQEKGYRYGRCDYSDCTCYGKTRRPNGGSLMLRGGPVDGSAFARPIPQILATTGTTMKPLRCTSVEKTGRSKAKSSSYETCLSWCLESFLDVYVSLDNLCCCQKN